MAEKRPKPTVEFDEKTEVGGYNPERRAKKKAPQVGPAPTDDPHREAGNDLKRKIQEKAPKLPAD